jgi:hypothetical protein
MAQSFSSDELRSWGEALKLYLKDPHAHKLMRHVAIRVVPALAVVNAVDDFAFPIIGWADDLFWPILILLMVQMLIKINTYRHQVTTRTIIDQ